MKLLKLTFALAIILTTSSAQAIPTVINFISLADGTEYGESGYSSLDIGIVSITTTKSSLITNSNPNGSAFAYLDRGTAGLGVCGFVTDTGKQGNSGSNKCLNASGGQAAGDDNVTTNEALSFIFSQNVTISNIWFNNNHDGGFGRQDFVTIEDSEYDAVLGYAGDSNAYSTWNIAAGESFDVSYYNEEFYISGIEFSTVPEPGILALLALGLFGIAVHRRNDRV